MSAILTPRQDIARQHFGRFCFATGVRQTPQVQQMAETGQPVPVRLAPLPGLFISAPNGSRAPTCVERQIVNRRHSGRRVPLWRIAAQLEVECRYRMQRPERHRGIRASRLTYLQEAGLYPAVSKLHLPSSVRERAGPNSRADEVRKERV